MDIYLVTSLRPATRKPASDLAGVPATIIILAQIRTRTAVP